MNKRNLALIAGILAIGLVAASIAGGQLMTVAAQSQQETDQSEQPTVSTSGSSTVNIDPDKVTVNIGVETNGKTAAEAASENAKIVNKVLEALKTMGISTDQIATSNYSVFPVYEMRAPPCIEIFPQPPECAPKSEIVGYRAVNAVTVTVEANADVGKIIDSAVEAGANNVSGAYFFVSEERQQEIRDSLIEGAILNAKNRAEKAANAVDLEIVGVKSINLNDVYFPVFYKELAADGAQSGTPILPGEQQVTMTVQVVFTMG